MHEPLRYKIRFRLAAGPGQTWGMVMGEGKKGALALLGKRIHVSWKREKFRTALLPLAFLGPLWNLVSIVAEMCHNEREELWIDSDASEALFDAKRKEVSLCMSDGRWLLVKVVRRRRFAALIEELTALLGPRIAPGTFGQLDRGMRTGLRVLLVFVILALLLSLALFWLC